MNKTLLILAVLTVLLGTASPVQGQEASFRISPPKGDYKIGETFSVEVLIDTEGENINAGQAVVYFPLETLKVAKVSKANSIFSLWVQEPVYSNSTGQISFGGGLPSPGFGGVAGRVITIFFQGKSAGQARVYFEKESILANDPKGTNIFSRSSGGEYRIGLAETPAPKVLPPEVLEKVPAPPEPFSPTHPFSDKWYSNNSPQFQWTLPSKIIGVSTSFNQELALDPGDVSQGAFDSRAFEGVGDGVWYFHIKFKNDIGWSNVSHLKIRIDTQPPHPFEIIIDNEGDLTNPSPLLYLKAKDDTSGISHYEIKIGEGDIFSLSEFQVSPFRLPPQLPGIHRVEVGAIDKAGNKTTVASDVEIGSIAVPQIDICPDTFVAGQEILYIEGSGLPGVKVLVFLKRNENLIRKWEVSSNEKGEWSLREEGGLAPGVYKISARSQDLRGAISNPSKECILKVVLKGIAIGPWMISYEFLALIFIFLLLAILAWLVFLLWRNRKARRSIRREIKDLKDKFYKEYNELVRDIGREIELFKRSKGHRPLTPSERKREKELLGDLADVERVFREELEDVEGGE